MTRLLSPPSRFPFAIALLLGIGLVVVAVTLAQLLQLDACPLCILQRMLYLALSVAAILGLLAAGQRFWRAVAAFLIAVISVTGVVVAGYQSYLQRFSHSTECTSAIPWYESFADWAGQKLPMLFRASGLCSEPGWKFLGLSIAEWSLLAFCFLTVLAVVTLFRRR